VSLRTVPWHVYHPNDKFVRPRYSQDFLLRKRANVLAHVKQSF
jgi:hypothetical protein